MRLFLMSPALAGLLLLAPAHSAEPSKPACIIAVSTPAGMICVKPDGNVDVPKGVTLDRASRQFWEEVGRTMRLLRVGECI